MLTAISILCLVSGQASAEPTYLGVYYQGKRVGFHSINVAQDQFEGQPAIPTEGRWDPGID